VCSLGKEAEQQDASVLSGDLASGEACHEEMDIEGVLSLMAISQQSRATVTTPGRHAVP